MILRWFDRSRWSLLKRVVMFLSDRREKDLQEKFNEEMMPCRGCVHTRICRYFNSIKRLDYDPEIFTISISCNMRQGKEDSDESGEHSGF